MADISGSGKCVDLKRNQPLTRATNQEPSLVKIRDFLDHQKLKPGEHQHEQSVSWAHARNFRELAAGSQGTWGICESPQLRKHWIPCVPGIHLRSARHLHTRYVVFKGTLVLVLNALASNVSDVTLVAEVFGLPLAGAGRPHCTG